MEWVGFGQTKLHKCLMVSATLHSPHSKKPWDVFFLRSYLVPESPLQEFQA